MTTGELRAQLIDKHVMAIQKVLLGNHVRAIVIQEQFDKKIVKMIEEMQTITEMCIRDRWKDSGES